MMEGFQGDSVVVLKSRERRKSLQRVLAVLSRGTGAAKKQYRYVEMDYPRAIHEDGKDGKYLKYNASDSIDL
jgi:hypothetical protein